MISARDNPSCKVAPSSVLKSTRIFLVSCSIILLYCWKTHGVSKCCDSTGLPQPVLSCDRLGLPQENIPLPPQAYTFSRGTSANFVLGILDMEPPVFLALPRFFSKRIDETTGKFSEAGNSKDIINRASKGEPSDGVFIDVGGWIGDSSFPSAALGFDTYVFEPVRYNVDLMHVALTTNNCTISEHLLIVNALVGQYDGQSSVYVSSRADNSAASKKQATLNVGESDVDFEQSVAMIRLDSFFPPGTKAQHLKIDVQGNELSVLRGAERLLKENKGRLRVRFEYHEKLLRASNTDPQELIRYMTSLGYRVVSKGEDVDME